MAARQRKAPKRFGELAANLSFQSEESEPFGDDSVEDATYSPSVEKNTSVRSETDSVVSSSALNFESQFEKIDQSLKLESATKSTNEGISAQICSNQSNVASESSFEAEVLRQLKMLNDRSVEMLARVNVIERSMIKNGTLLSIQEQEEKDGKFSVFMEYSASKRMPFKTVTEFREFESGLDSKKPMEEAVSFIYI